MRANLNPLINSCGTWTVPATETKSIGYRPTLSCLCFCRAILTILSWYDKSCPLIGTSPSGRLNLDETLFVHLSGLCKNKSNLDADGNKTIPPAVRFHNSEKKKVFTR